MMSWFSDSDSIETTGGGGDNCSGGAWAAELLGTPLGSAGAKLLAVEVSLADTNSRRVLRVLASSGLSLSLANDCRSISAPISFHGIYITQWVSFYMQMIESKAVSTLYPPTRFWFRSSKLYIISSAFVIRASPDSPVLRDFLNLFLTVLRQPLHKSCKCSTSLTLSLTL